MPKVIVTGATGYIAAHCCNEFLQKGIDVVGIVRDTKKGEELKATLAKLGGKGTFTYGVVPDMQKEGCYDEFVKGCDGFIHVASPFFTENVTDPMVQLIEPALKGTRNALLAAKSEPKCKRIVVTSSFAAVMSSTKGAGYKYTEADWNEESRPVGGNGQESYRASKALAEKSAWDYAEKEKPHFTVATLCPPLVVGRAIHPVTTETLNTSLLGIYRAMSGQIKAVPPAGLGFVAVQDLAKAHVAAFEKEAAGGKRFLMGEGWYSFAEEYAILAKLFPEVAHNIPQQNPPYAQGPILSNEQAKSILGIQFTGLEAMLKDSGEFLIELAKKEGKDITKA